MKRKSLFLAALMLAVTLCFGLAACGEDKIVLKDFPAESTETVELGSVYSLKTNAEGENGATYRLSAQVVTKDGGAVAVFDNRFDVTDVSGYTITYTAVVTSGAAPKSVVTLNVTDNTAPDIAINTPDTGVLNEEYCLPNISVTDLAGTQPTVAVKVYLVQGETKTEVTELAERDGKYYFTPDTLGSYEIAVTASKSNGKSKTATRTFVVDQPVLEGEVFSPDVFDPEAQLEARTNGATPDISKLVVGKVTPTQEEAASAAYKGNYLKIDGSKIGSGWVNFYLTPRQDIESYAQFDTVEFWVYFAMTGANAKIGLLGGSTGASDPLMREFKGNTWTKISVPAATFFELIDSKALFPVDFNNAGSVNHVGVTEVRIGTVMAKYAFETEVVVNAPATTTDQNSSVTLTADTDVDFTAEIKNAEGDTQQCTVENGVVTASLPVGNYTYTLTSADDLYVGSVTGSFTVECNTQIVLPAEFTGTAMTQLTIPEAKITVDGAETQNIAQRTAKFTPAYGDAVVDNITGSTFTPASSGTLAITYTYEGAVTKTLEVPIAKAENTTGALLDMRNADVLEYVHPGKTGSSFAYSSDGQYISWTGTGTWRDLKIDFHTPVDSLTDKDYLKVEVYFVQNESAPAPSKGVTGWFCNNGKFMIGSKPKEDGSGNEPDKGKLIPHGIWYTAYIPVSILTANPGILSASSDFMQVSFKDDGDGSWFESVQEVRLKGFVLVTEEEIPETTALVDMESLGTDSVADAFGADNGTQLSHVPAKDNERAYLSWTAGESTGTGAWCNLSVKQLAACNANDLYDYIAVELYYVGDADKTISWYFMAGGCTSNTGSGKRLTTNEWITVYIPIEQYFSIYKTSTSSVSPAGGTGYFTECVFDSAGSSHFPNISEVRIGDIFFTNTAGSAETDYVFTPNA